MIRSNKASVYLTKQRGIARSRWGVLGLGISLCAGSALAERPDFDAPREVKRRDSVTLTSARGPHTSAMLPAGASDAIERRITSRRNGTTHLHLRQPALGLDHAKRQTRQLLLREVRPSAAHQALDRPGA